MSAIIYDFRHDGRTNPAERRAFVIERDACPVAAALEHAECGNLVVRFRIDTAGGLCRDIQIARPSARVGGLTDAPDASRGETRHHRRGIGRISMYGHADRGRVAVVRMDRGKVPQSDQDRHNHVHSTVVQQNLRDPRLDRHARDRSLRGATVRRELDDSLSDTVHDSLPGTDHANRTSRPGSFDRGMLIGQQGSWNRKPRSG